MPLSRSEFGYTLPEHLIAQAPLPNRTDSRLMVLDPQHDSIEHRRFADLPELLGPDDLIVLNDTRVIRARLRGRKDSGGSAELLIERVESGRRALCQVRVSKPLKPGRTVLLEPTDEPVTVIERCGDLYRFEFQRAVDEVIDTCGQVPLPPYIARSPDEVDEARYQTVFAEHRGSVAAPTAGTFRSGIAGPVRRHRRTHRASDTARRCRNLPAPTGSRHRDAPYASRTDRGRRRHRG